MIYSYIYIDTSINVNHFQFPIIKGYAESGEVPIYGQNSILPKEHAQKFFNLPIVRFVRKQLQCGAIATWDSSIHDSTCLNTVTSGKRFLNL